MPASKLSPSSFAKLVHRFRTHPKDRASRTSIELRHVTAPSEEETVASWTLQEARHALWAEDAVRVVREHADSMGHGAHRYALRAVEADGDSARALPGYVEWARVYVKREAEDDEGPASVAVLHQQQQELLRALSSMVKDSHSMVATTQKQFAETLATMARAQSQREQREAELTDALTALRLRVAEMEVEARTRPAASLDGETVELLKVVGGAVWETHGAKILKSIGIDLLGDGANSSAGSLTPGSES